MILTIDQGTTGTTVLLINQSGKTTGRAYAEHTQIFPHPGWISHDANEIWETTQFVISAALQDANLTPSDISAIGITNQRETTLLWDRQTGQPVHHAIVWQCRRTTELCSDFRENGLEPTVNQKTGLVLDPYFSATKIIWLLENVPGLRSRAEKGEICFGTIDSYLLFRLTNGQHHLTDFTNASRTLCFNIHTHQWDPELLSAFNIPEAILPQVLPSCGIFGHTADTDGPLPKGIPIAGIAGDQQSALFGHRATSVGDLKNTYGTGCFALFQTGDSAITSNHGLLTTISCDPNGQPAFALEGSVFSAGSAVQWLRDGLGIIQSAPETEPLANSVSDTGGVYLVPAFTGLGAPYWDPNARGTIVGITRGTERAQIARAALEAIAYQSADLITAMSADANQSIDTLRVDGGAVENEFLMQFQADILNIPVVRPQNIETTALGAAMLAGLATGFWKTPEDLSDLNPPERVFEPNMTHDQRESLLEGWRTAVQTARQHIT